MWGQLALAGLSGLSALLGRNKKQESKTTTDQTSMPQYDPTALAFRDRLIGAYGGLMDGNEEFDNAYKLSGLNTIARQSRNLQGSVGDLLTARGLGRTSAGVGTLKDTLYGAGRSASDFINNAVLALDQRRTSNLGQAGGFLASLPTGTHTTGTQTTVGTQPQSGPGAFFGGVTQGLAGYMGQKYANESFANLLKKLPSRGTGSGYNMFDTSSGNDLG
jgi:hypothetical protein